MRKTTLAQRLAVVAGFTNPQASLEQYPTPPELAAHLIHVADLQDDIAERTVIDLGTGTGVLALGAALRGPRAVLGIDIDGNALATARKNRRRVGTATPVDWLRADVTEAPLRDRPAGGPDTAIEENERHRPAPTVVMNPPFGAQQGNAHADRRFLETAAAIAGVSYSVHNAGSRAFVEGFASDSGGEVTHGFGAELDVAHQFAFHEEATRALDVEVFRIEWGR